MPRADRITLTAKGPAIIGKNVLTSASLTSRAQEWEMTRYGSYQAQLAGQPIGETFRRAIAFLNLAANGSSLSRT